MNVIWLGIMIFTFSLILLVDHFLNKVRLQTDWIGKEFQYTDFQVILKILVFVSFVW